MTIFILQAALAATVMATIYLHQLSQHRRWLAIAEASAFSIIVLSFGALAG